MAACDIHISTPTIVQHQVWLVLHNPNLKKVLKRRIQIEKKNMYDGSLKSFCAFFNSIKYNKKVRKLLEDLLIYKYGHVKN